MVCRKIQAPFHFPFSPPTLVNHEVAPVGKGGKFKTLSLEMEATLPAFTVASPNGRKPRKWELGFLGCKKNANGFRWAIAISNQFWEIKRNLILSVSKEHRVQPTGISATGTPGDFGFQRSRVGEEAPPPALGGTSSLLKGSLAHPEGPSLEIL